MDRKILVVGAGLMFRVGHLPALTKMGISIAGIVEPSDAVAEQIKSLVGPNVFFYKSVDEVDLAQITHALVATPAGFHYPVIKQLAMYNIHVLCEKPIAINGEQARELRDIFSKKNNILQIGFQRRFFANSIKIKELIDNKTYGNLSHINIWAGWLAKNTLPASILNKEVSGGGISSDYGVHFIDTLLYWSKKLELVEYYDDSFGGIEVNSATFARMDMGGVGYAGVKIYQSWTNTIGNTMQLYFDDALVIAGINVPSSLELFNINNQVTDIRKVVTKEVINLEAEASRNPLIAQWEEFLARGDNKEGVYLSNLDDAVKATEFIEECYKNKKQLELNWGY